MRARTALSLLLLVSAFAVAKADDKKTSRPDGAKHALLEQFKQLAGEWVGKEVGNGSEGEVHVKYKVTSNGSTIVETIFPGTEHEMITTIHQDGDDLVLKHYCALGNQPHMKARGKAGDKKIPFEFTHASNLKSEKDMYMHDVTFTFVDKDTLKTEWTHYRDGKPAGKAVFELKRKK